MLSHFCKCNNIISTFKANEHEQVLLLLNWDETQRLHEIEQPRLGTQRLNLNSYLTTEYSISSDSLSQSTNKRSCLRCVWLVCTVHNLCCYKSLPLCSPIQTLLLTAFERRVRKSSKVSVQKNPSGIEPMENEKHVCWRKSGSLYSTPNSCHQPPSQPSSFPFPGLLTSLEEQTISKFVVVLMFHARHVWCTL